MLRHYGLVNVISLEWRQ